ncbi:carbon-nitrogen hydrolase [Bombardia bombarda]|uniref:Carbon-nitrogen hydrolase n=1 Tax=Bombardia bombarda TaxID=252184 RepID=A0AA39XIL0_9PEZI|nr:carbon-nitrogen hydrolase [Bombardia bombarda]
MAPPAATPKIRLGTASPGTRATTPETLAQLDQIAHRAAEKKIDILLLPEAYIGGYPRGTAFGCLMGSRSNEGRDEYLRYFQSAVDLGDTVGDGAGAGDAWLNKELQPTTENSNANGNGNDSDKAPRHPRGDGTREELERIAHDTGVFLVAGCIEKAGGSLYCAVVYVCPHRGIIGKRRKVMPTGTERLVWAQGSPATLRAVSTTIRGVRVNLAAVICWENYMPLVRQALYAQNVNLYLAPTADNRDAWLSLMRTVAIEGRCFVVSSNMCVPSSETVSVPAAGQTQRSVQEHHPVNDGPNSIDDDEDDFIQESPPARRRSSFKTAEGFEIALPSPPQSQPPSSRPTSSVPPTRRKSSIFDEDGNEIVLPCIDGTTSSPTTVTSPSSRAKVRAAATRGSLSMSTINGPSQTDTPTSSTTTTTATKNPAEFVSRGGSSIISPFGDVLAGPQWEDDHGIISVDVDFEDCIRGRLDLDTAGSYSRNDSFRFSVQGLDLSPLPY